MLHRTPSIGHLNANILSDWLQGLLFETVYLGPECRTVRTEPIDYGTNLNVESSNRLTGDFTQNHKNDLLMPIEYGQLKPWENPTLRWSTSALLYKPMM